METKQEVKTYTLSEEQFGDMVLQVGILKEMYSKITDHTGMNLFQKKVLTSNKVKNLEVLKDMEDLFEKSQ